MKATKEAINRFLTENFNYVLRFEEKAMSGYHGGALSLNEFHIIEAVYRAAQRGANTMGGVSRRMGVTMGTLTTAAKTLEKKGYLTRHKGQQDKRLVWLEPTPISAEANAYHKKFHEGIVTAATASLDEKQLMALAGALRTLSGYFSRMKMEAVLTAHEEDGEAEW